MIQTLTLTMISKYKLGDTRGVERLQASVFGNGNLWKYLKFCNCPLAPLGCYTVFPCLVYPQVVAVALSIKDSLAIVAMTFPTLCPTGSSSQGCRNPWTHLTHEKPSQTFLHYNKTLMIPIKYACCKVFNLILLKLIMYVYRKAIGYKGDGRNEAGWGF